MDNNQQKINTLFNKLFERWAVEVKEYTPGEVPEDTPKYSPQDVNAGPKPITIEEYRRRNAKPTAVNNNPKKLKNKKQKRAGKKVKRRQELAALYRQLHTTTDKEAKAEIRKKINSINNGQLQI